MATVPTVPSFALLETPTIAKLNQLAACVTFLNTNPTWFAATNSTSVVLLTATETIVTGWTASADRDSGLATPGKYVAGTPGYFDMAAHVDFTSNSTGYRHAYFQVTTGSGNPGGAGITTVFGGAGASADASTDTHLEISQLSPYLYVGDFVQVFAWQNSGGNLALGTGCQWFVNLDSLGP